MQPVSAMEIRTVSDRRSVNSEWQRQGRHLSFWLLKPVFHVWKARPNGLQRPVDCPLDDALDGSLIGRTEGGLPHGQRIQPLQDLPIAQELSITVRHQDA